MKLKNTNKLAIWALAISASLTVAHATPTAVTGNYSTVAGPALADTLTAGSGSGTITVVLGSTLTGNLGTTSPLVITVPLYTTNNSGSLTALAGNNSAGVTVSAATTINNLATGTISSVATSFQGISLTGGVGSTITNSGNISGSSDGIKGALGTLGTITNNSGGVIQGTAIITSIGVEALGALTINNNAAATINGAAYGINASDGLTVNNSGTINTNTTTGGTAVLATTNASITNNAGGSISAGLVGVNAGSGLILINKNLITATATTATTNGVLATTGANITNSGTINAAATTTTGNGVQLTTGTVGTGTITNTGIITGTTTGVTAGNGLTLTNSNMISATAAAGIGVQATTGASIINSGTISAAAGNGVQLTTGTGTGTITNSGIITGATTGVTAGNGLTLTNSNAISATAAAGSGVLAITGANITNNVGGSISGAATGVIAADGLILNNSGTIYVTAAGTGVLGTSAGSGVFATTGATITNSGTITTALGNSNGVNLTSGTVINTGTITNTGTISGTSTGITFSGGTTTNSVTNSGIIGTIGTTAATSSAYGVNFAGTNSNDILNMNGGTINGVIAVNLGAGDDTFNFKAGIVNGNVDGGAGVNTLNFTGISGDAAIINGNLLNIQNLNRVGNGGITINGSIGTSAIKLNTGTMVLNNTTLANTTGDVTINGGSLVINGNATVSLTSSVAAGAVNSTFTDIVLIPPPAAPTLGFLAGSSPAAPVPLGVTSTVPTSVLGTITTGAITVNSGSMLLSGTTTTNAITGSPFSNVGTVITTNPTGATSITTGAIAVTGGSLTMNSNAVTNTVINTVIDTTTNVTINSSTTGSSTTATTTTTGGATGATSTTSTTTPFNTTSVTLPATTKSTTTTTTPLLGTITTGAITVSGGGLFLNGNNNTTTTTTNTATTATTNTTTNTIGATGLTSVLTSALTSATYTSTTTTDNNNTRANNFNTGAIVVTGGRLFINGNLNTFTTINTISLGGGELGGAGTWNAIVNQTGGSFTPGLQTGDSPTSGSTPFAVGNLSISSLTVTGGTLTVNMNAANQSSNLLTVNGNAKISGASTILVTPATLDAPLQTARVLGVTGTRTGQYSAASLYLAPGRVDTGIVAAASPDGAFTSSTLSLSVDSGNPALGQKVDDTYVTVAHHYDTVSGLSAAGKQLGGAFNDQVGNPLLADFLGALDYSPLASTVAGTINAYAATDFQASLEYSAVSAREIHRIVEQQNLGDSMYPSNNHVWANYNYNNYSNSGSANRFTIGLGSSTMDTFHFGGLVSYASSDLSSNSTIDTIAYGAYIGMGAPTGWQINGYVGGSHNKTSTSTTAASIAVPALYSVSSFNPDGNSFQALLSGAYMMEEDICKWGPTFGVEMVKSSLKGTITPGAALPAIEYSSNSLTSMRTLIGVRAEFTVNSKVHPYVSAQGAREFDGDNNGYTANFQGSTFKVKAPIKLATDSIILRGGVVVGLCESCFADFGYMGEYSTSGDNTDYNGLNLGLRATF